MGAVLNVYSAMGTHIHTHTHTYTHTRGSFVLSTSEPPYFSLNKPPLQSTATHFFRSVSCITHTHTLASIACMFRHLHLYSLSHTHTHTHTPASIACISGTYTYTFSRTHTHTHTHCARKCRHENQTAVLEGLRSTAVRGSYAPSLLSRSDNSTQLCGV